MAATIARAIGYDNTRSKSVHRLGSRHASVEAATWQTFARATVNRDGSGYVEIARGSITRRFRFNAEDEALAVAED